MAFAGAYRCTYTIHLKAIIKINVKKPLMNRRVNNIRTFKLKGKRAFLFARF